jgi:fumarate reductase (CoM/CoB) subunit B
VALPKPLAERIEPREDKGLDTCLTCPKLCRWACPVAEAEARETVSPHALVVLAGLMKKSVVPPESAGDLPYHCSHCGACTEACLHRNDVPFLLSLARGRSIAGHATPAAVNEVRGNFGVAGNPQGAALDGVLARVTQEADVDLARSGHTVYFPGCETLASFPEAATAFLRVSLLFGISGVAVTPASAACCGLPLFWAGDLDAYRSHAERFAAQVKDVETLVVHDSACAYSMKVRYADVGVELAPRVVHVSEFLAEKLPSLEVQPKDAASRPRLAYADACSVARGLGLVDEPRALVQKVAETVELPGLRGRSADCCGASGLLPLSAPETSRTMAEAKIQAFRDSGAAELVTASPRCAAHLRSVDPSLPVLDLAMLLARL